MDKTGVAHVLDQYASLLELTGENPFRVRAFRAAARTVAGLPGSLGTALESGSLAAARGIGPAILEMATQLHRTNRSEAFEALRDQVPSGLIEMLAISGLGVTKVKRIHEHLAIDSVADLEAAAHDGRLATVPGFGPKTCQNILRGLGYLRRASSAWLLHHAMREASDLQAALERLPGVLRVIPAGDLRRRMEIVRDLVLVIVTDVPSVDLIRHLAQVPSVDEIDGRDERRATLRFAGGAVVQVVVTPPVNLGAVLVQATGNRTHVAQLAARAASQGFALHGAALWKGSAFVPTPDEATLYHALGLPEIPPELREGMGELEWGDLPPLVEVSDLQGFLHCHTNYSDGSSTVEELARACAAAGYTYLGVTDHSSVAAFAGGLRIEDLERQWTEVDRVNDLVPSIRVLKGIEVDILPDGHLDYGAEVLKRFDFVIGSIHEDAGHNEAEMTARILKALDNPYLTIIGHPTGRQLLSREAYPMDLAQIFDGAALRGVAMEINADPHRLDLDWRVLHQAKAAGVTISIGADAHHVGGLENMNYGVSMARKAGLGPSDILNTRSVEAFLDYARMRRPS